MTKDSSCQWTVVYLGIGRSARFRCLRDFFFPGLNVIGFDSQLEPDLERGSLRHIAQLGPDSQDLVVHERSLDFGSDCGWIKERLQNRKLLLISRIKPGTISQETLEFQLQAIKQLCPLTSLVSFKPPDDCQFYRYAPGVMLKEVYQEYGEHEVRLVIDGVPTSLQCYNCSDFSEQMRFHHNSLRGAVYAPMRPGGCMACLDSCFDCSILWRTLADYGQRNGVDPHEVLRQVMGNSDFTPLPREWMWLNPDGVGWKSWTVEDASWLLGKGRLTEALAALELDVHGDRDSTDLVDLACGIAWAQPSLADRMKQDLTPSASLPSLVHVLGTLSKPFTFLRNYWNAPFNDQGWEVVETDDKWGWWGSSWSKDASHSLALEDEPPSKKHCYLKRVTAHPFDSFME